MECLCRQRLAAHSPAGFDDPQNHRRVSIPAVCCHRGGGGDDGEGFLEKLVTPCHLERERAERETCKNNPRLEDRNEP